MILLKQLFFPEFRLNKVPRNIHPFLNVDGPGLHHLILVGLQSGLLAEPLHFLPGEEIAPGSILSAVQILGYFGAGFESDLSHVVATVVTK